MSLSQSSEINLTDNGKQALNAKALANSAHRVADDAHDLAYSAQKTADGKNRVFRGSDPNTIPTSELKEGDIYFTDNSLYVWDGSTWVKMVSDTTQAEINAKVADAMAKAKSAEETADGKNRVFRVKDLNTISTSSLKTGDICFTDDTIYVWNGTTWEKTVSDTTGAEIRAKVTEAIKKAKSAEETADSKNRVFRVKDPNTISNTGLKEGDICFTDNAVYTWTGGTWEKTVSDTTGAEIKARVDQATQESHKAVNELKTNIESKVKELDYDVESTRTNLTEVTNKIANDLSATKENLSAVKSDLSATKGDLENTKTSLTSSLDNAKKDIATTTSDLNSVKTSLADTRSSLATTANDLTSVKADLADTKNNLTTTTNDIKNGLSAVRNDLSATKTNLENTKNSLSTTVANLQKQTGQLSGSLETANSKIKYNSNAIAEVKHTAEEISTTVSGMKVGGRNLVLGTQEAKTIFDGTGYTNMRDITFESGYYWPDLQRVVLKEHLSNLGLTYDDTLTVTGNLTISKNGTSGQK
ncbi:adsorption protein [Lactobacillus phage Ldl1]|uniref:Adsorption protein n=1 Tax=Lactobacillus phage Ldl1 TaxID=1552735 RepID=A0A0A7DMZ4_9CAUD|nr:tail protein [Lactobacillus phage Ldl1]AIS73884.1 adsorption protein [Lactobacillus phage Ldl1]